MITKFKLFWDRSKIHRICKKFNIKNYNINPDGSVSVNGDVNIMYLLPWDTFPLHKLPIGFKDISGDFRCSSNKLTSLEGCPEKVGGDFICYGNSLTSLEGCPKEVGGDFDCCNNQLTSLQWCPEKVGGDFDCHYNQLTSLQWCPEKVGGDFDCYNNDLTSLQGCPKEVGGYFDCSDNYLTSLEGCPEKVGGNFYCFHNQLTSLEGCPDAREIHCHNNKISSFEGIPEFFESYIDVSDNPVDEIYALFNRDPQSIYWIREYYVIRNGNEVSKNRLEEVFHTMKMEIPKDIKLENYKLV